MGIFFADDEIQNYLLLSFRAAIMKLSECGKCLHRFLNEVFEHRHDVPVGLIFLFFLLQYIKSEEKIHCGCVSLMFIKTFLNCLLSLLNYKPKLNVLLM